MEWFEQVLAVKYGTVREVLAAVLAAMPMKFRVSDRDADELAAKVATYVSSKDGTTSSEVLSLFCRLAIGGEGTVCSLPPAVTLDMGDVIVRAERDRIEFSLRLG